MGAFARLILFALSFNKISYLKAIPEMKEYIDNVSNYNN